MGIVSVSYPAQRQPAVGKDGRLERVFYDWGANVTRALVIRGLGDPSGVVVADVGTLYARLDGGAGSTLYVKEAGTGTSAGWRAV